LLFPMALQAMQGSALFGTASLTPSGPAALAPRCSRSPSALCVSRSAISPINSVCSSQWPFGPCRGALF